MTRPISRYKNHLYAFLLLVFVLYSPAICLAEDDVLFSHLRWRLIGPFRAGRVLAVTGVRGQPNHFYFGAVNGGVWETDDAGRTWHPIFDDMPVGSIGAIAVAPSNSDILYVGSGEADMRSDIGYGNGMYRSSDGGHTWKHIGLADSHQIGKILVHPENENVLYVAVLGHAYGPNEERGVFRSTDGGESWQKILYKDGDTGAIDLAFGEDEKTIYAALWQTRRPPWNVYPPSYGPGSGLYKSVDGGEHWSQVTGNGFPVEGLGRVGIAVAPTHPNIVYALVDAKEGGLYRSEDSGATWTQTTDDSRIWNRGWYFGGITVDPKNPDVIYACNTTLYQSVDGGITFLPFRGSPGGDDFHSLWIDPDDSQRMITGVDQGTIITLNGGKTWSSWYNQPTGQFYHVITDNRFPYWVYGAQQDSGAAGVPSRTTSRDGINMMQFRRLTAGDENGYMAPDPMDPEVVYGDTVSRLDARTEQTTSVNPVLAYPDLYRRVWTLPLTFSPHDPSALYFANQRLFRTNDGGKHWTILSPDLTRKELTVPPNLDPVSAENYAEVGPRRGVIYSIALSPVRDHMIWTGTDDGLVWLSMDEGQNWKDVTPAELTPWSKVGIIEASHSDAGTAYLAVDRHRLDDYKPYIYRTEDYGKSWTLKANGIPDGSFVNVVREDPKKMGLLYAGTELGMYVSLDDGDHWLKLQLNLPVSSVRDIDVHEDDLVIATHGRAFWILDNVTSLRQLNAISDQTEAWLFEPATAYRVHPEGFAGTPFPKDEPLAQNPPSGAVIEYFLRTKAQTPIKIEILDENGKIVRAYSSEDQPRKVDTGKILVTPDWAPLPQIPGTNAGTHRLVWDLHHTMPDALQSNDPSEIEEPPGLWALPGRYTVKFTVNGTSYTQPLLVRNDPRVTVSQEDLVLQFQFAQKLETERVKLGTKVTEVKNLLKQAEFIREKTPRELAAQIRAFEKNVFELTGLHTGKPQYGTSLETPTKVTSFSYLKKAFDDLQKTVMTADGAPSPDALTGFEKQRAFLQKALKDWEELKGRLLPDLNRDLQKAGLTPLTP